MADNEVAIVQTLKLTAQALAGLQRQCESLGKILAIHQQMLLILAGEQPDDSPSSRLSAQAMAEIAELERMFRRGEEAL